MPKISIVGRLKNEMSLHPTADGSFTVISDSYGEAYHSLGGALTEAQELYVERCGLIEAAAKNKKLRILDIGFGLGYNVFVAIWRIHQVNPQCNIEISSFENSERGMSFLDYPEEILPLATEIKREWKREEDRYVYRHEETSLEVYMTDARRGVSQLTHSFDAIFHDPFSPPKNPELWTVDFFKLLGSRLKKGGKLSTYSMATPVLSAMGEAGFYPELVPGTSPKRFACVAHKEKILLSPEVSRKIKTSPERTPYRDPSLSGERSEIIERRLKEKADVSL